MLEKISDVEDENGEVVFNGQGGAIAVYPKFFTTLSSSTTYGVVFESKEGYFYIYFEGDEWKDKFMRTMSEYGYIE